MIGFRGSGKGEVGLELVQERVSINLLFQRLSLAVAVFLLCLLGILSRTHFDLAAIWPANAFLLGMMLRFPQLVSPLAWMACGLAYIGADAVTGTDLLPNLILNSCNLLSIAVGYCLLAWRPMQDRQLSDPYSVLYFLRAVIGASLASGVGGMLINPVLFGDRAWEGFFLWAATDLVHYVALLPMFLTMPDLGSLHFSRRSSRPGNFAWMEIVAPLALVISATAGAVVGGPGAVAFPVPALLWCAIIFSPFLTACISFAFVTWALVSIRLGVMVVWTEEDTKSTLISARVGVALVALAPIFVAGVMTARNRMMRKLRFYAERDPMTGLRNRRAFLSIGANLHAESSNGTERTALLMIDLDHFKSINDRYGHDGGDRVLSSIAAVLEYNVRPDDVVARIGGEEFCALIPRTSAETAHLLADRLIKAVSDTDILLSDGANIRVTASIGVYLAGPDMSFEELLRSADRAMYEAKALGRDRYVLASA